MNKVQTEDKRFIRDINNHALLNTDIKSLMNHRRQKQIEDTKNKELADLKEEINILKERNLQLESVINKIAKELKIDGS